MAPQKVVKKREEDEKKLGRKGMDGEPQEAVYLF